jgi:hypothetical protein
MRSLSISHITRGCQENIHLALKEVLVAFEACCLPFPSLTFAFYLISYVYHISAKVYTLKSASFAPFFLLALGILGVC